MNRNFGQTSNIGLRSIGIQAPTRYNNAIFTTESRNLLSGIAPIKAVNTPSGEVPFINEPQAISEREAARMGLSNNQGGEGLLSSILDAGKAISGFVPGQVGELASNVASTAGKVKLAIEGAKVAAKLGSELAFGKVGTTISNVLSEKFNKNPNWKPGFVGEQHLVLNTPHGLTRANFCGPRTQLMKRLNRGDVGVNQIDVACNKHDLLYHFAKTKEDIRRADEIMINEVSKVTDSGGVQKAIIKAGIRAKTLGEDVGLFSAETFTDLPGLSGSGFGRNFANSIHLGFLGESPRHLGGILGRVNVSPNISLAHRFGGNGIIRGEMLSGQALRGEGIRKAGILGNVKGRDPTISGNISSTITGTGNNALVNILRNKPHFGTPPELFTKNSNLSLKQKGGLLPGETRDLSITKSIDPTISNLVSSNPGGEGLSRLDASSGLGAGPGSILRENVLKGLKRDRKRASRLKVRHEARKLTFSRKSRTDAVATNQRRLRQDASRRRRDKARGVVRRRPGDPNELFTKNSKESNGDLISNKSIRRRMIREVLDASKTGRGNQAGGQIIPLLMAAATAAKFIIPPIIDAFKKKKKKKKQRGRGKILPGSILAANLARANIKNFGLGPAELAKLKKLIGGKGINGTFGGRREQGGGQLGLLAGLAASFILPKIIKAVRGK